MADLTQVNPQIKDAVRTTNQEVFQDARQRGAAAVFQQVAQSAGLAIQDGTDHLQNILALDAAVTGKAAAIILSDPEKIPQALLAVETLQEAVQKSISVLAQIGETSDQIVSEFPQS